MNMPNGTQKPSESYNLKWCLEKHQRIDDRLKTFDNRLWAILTLALVEVIGIAGILILVIATVIQ